jgi:hypothetical protein
VPNVAPRAGRAGVSRAPGPRCGQWLREQRQARGWAASDLIRRLRAAATSVGDRLPANNALTAMVYRWEDDRSGISERYRLHYCRVLEIPISEFGKSPPPQPQSCGLLAGKTALVLAEAGLMLLSASVEYLCNGGSSGAPPQGASSRKASELAARMRAAQRELNGSIQLLTWKVWSDQELLFEGDEDKARQFLVERIADEPDLTLESSDGYSYCYQDGRWTASGSAGWDEGV